MNNSDSSFFASAAKPSHLALGEEGEAIALAYLKKKGGRVLARNWRPSGLQRGLELDLVIEHEGSIVFVEVKTRMRRKGTTHEEGVPVYASFTATKQKRLMQAAQLYLTAHNLWDRPCRFDLICVSRMPDGSADVEYSSHVIELGNSLGHSNATWQPW